MKLLIYSQTWKVQPLEFRNGQNYLTHTLLGILLLIQAVI